MKKFLLAVLLSSLLVTLSSVISEKSISKVAETAPPSPLANVLRV